MSLFAQNDDDKSQESLDILIQACKVDPKNPQVRTRNDRRNQNESCCFM